MNVLQSLKFVQGAVSKKDFVPALTHFQIRDGRITGYDGKMSLSAPIALDLDCCPKADTFAKAIATCEETAQLHMAANGKLAVRSGKFKAAVECLPPELYPGVVPQGDYVQVNGNLLEAFRIMYDFSAEDASRPWAAGVLLDGNYMVATNNVVFAQHWIGFHFPYRANIPRATVKELLRIGENPTVIQITGNSIVFHYEGDRWLQSHLVQHEWPNVDGLMAKIQPWHQQDFGLTQDFWEAIDTLEPFVDGLNHLYMDEDGMHTAKVDGADVQVKGLPQAVVNHKMLTLLAGVAHTLDIGAWPQPMTWYGENIRGLFVGMAE